VIVCDEGDGEAEGGEADGGDESEGDGEEDAQPARTIREAAARRRRRMMPWTLSTKSGFRLRVTAGRRSRC
jgi:hypothetical protein